MDEQIITEFIGLKKGNKKFVLKINNKNNNSILLKYSLKNNITEETTERLKKEKDIISDVNMTIQKVTEITGEKPVKIEIKTDNINQNNINMYKEWLLENENHFLDITFNIKNKTNVTLQLKKGYFQIISKSFIFNSEKGTVLPVTLFHTLENDWDIANKILKMLNKEQIIEIL